MLKVSREGFSSQSFGLVLKNQTKRQNTKEHKMTNIRMLLSCCQIMIIIIVTYKQCSLKKTQDALQAYVIQCCGTGVPSGVAQKLPSTVTKDAGRLVDCSRCLDRKQHSSCDRRLRLSVAHSVCRRQPTSDADVQQAQPPVGKAQPDTGVQARRHLLTSIAICILSAGQPEASANPA